MTPEPDAKQRGIFERDKGSGTWWIQWFDAACKRHRKRVGARALAVAAYGQRRREAVLQRKFPRAWREVYEAEWRPLISRARPPRGVFERPKGSGTFWAQWLDAAGKRHRESGGSVTAATLLWYKGKIGREIEASEVRPFLLALGRSAQASRPARPGPKLRAAKDKSGYRVARMVEAALPVFERLCPELTALPRRTRKRIHRAEDLLAGKGFSAQQIEAASRAPSNPLRSSRWFVSFQTGASYDTVAFYHRKFRKLARRP